MDIINKNKENINYELFDHYFDYLKPDIMIEKLKNACYEAFKVEENKKVIDIVERILELNSEKQVGLGLKILPPD